MSTDTLDLRDQLALAAPINFDFALRVWGDADVDLVTDVSRHAFMAVWAMARYEWARVVLEHRAEPQREPGQPLPPTAEDRRMDRQIISLDFWDYRVTKPLAAAGITTLRQLLALDIYRLDAIKGIGPDGLRDILDRLNREGLRLAPRSAPVADLDPAPVMGDDAIGA